MEVLYHTIQKIGCSQGASSSVDVTCQGKVSLQEANLLHLLICYRLNLRLCAPCMYMLQVLASICRGWRHYCKQDMISYQHTALVMVVVESTRSVFVVSSCTQ